ncbi:hypothetical protein CJ030_MR3G011153 [Morella rubra]|uniref:Uncharacterized protein n=1 Tax=Morella rubra TaxID=262757 RepID=A0A6A1W655_9ROSI|nr:hypothetical protein CJ030_MR3G011153 [Morella rubra]
MGAKGSGSKEKQMAEEDCDFYDGEHEMTEEECLFYNSSFEVRSFDVPAIPDVFSCGMIQPYDITSERERIEVGLLSQLAIDEYNHRFEDLVEGGMIKTCQAMVFRGRGLKMLVKSFRLKLPEYEQGNVE